jgi:hypothetical protein
MGLPTGNRQLSTRTSYNATAHNLHHFNYHSSCNADNNCHIYIYSLHNDFHLNDDFHQYDIIDQFQLYVNQESHADQYDHIILLHWDRYEQYSPDSDHYVHYNSDFNLNYHINLNNHCR